MRVARSTMLRQVASACLLLASTQADAKKIDSLLSSLHGTVDSFYNAIIVVFTLVGVWMVAHALMGFYKSSQAQGGQQIPVRAYWVALFVGGALTSVGVVAAIVSNTLMGD